MIFGICLSITKWVQCILQKNRSSKFVNIITNNFFIWLLVAILDQTWILQVNLIFPFTSQITLIPLKDIYLSQLRKVTCQTTMTIFAQKYLLALDNNYRFFFRYGNAFFKKIDFALFKDIEFGMVFHFFYLLTKLSNLFRGPSNINLIIVSIWIRNWNITKAWNLFRMQLNLIMFCTALNCLLLKNWIIYESLKTSLEEH